MAAAKRTRWECPTGEHPAVLGPTKPRRDNIVRYCLPCSQATGKLVERVAPVVERRRVEQAARTTAKRKAREARTKAKEDAYFTVAGVDLRVELKRMARLPAFRGRKGRLYRRTPSLVVTRRKYVPSRLGAASPWENKIWISDYAGIDRADVLETLLHEMVHIHIGHDPSDRAHWHGKEFRSKLREAFDEAFPEARRWGIHENRYHGDYARALRDAWATPEGNRAVADRRDELAAEIEGRIANGESKDDFVDPKQLRWYAEHLRKLADEKVARVERAASKGR